LDEDYKNDVVEEKVIVKSGEKYIAKVYYPDLSLLNLPYGQNFNSEAVNKLYDAAKRFSAYHNLTVLGIDGLILFANEWNTHREKMAPVHTDLLLFSPSNKRIFPSLKHHSTGVCLSYMSAIKSYQVKDYRAAFCFFKKVKKSFI
jgi:hypothetical protein